MPLRQWYLKAVRTAILKSQILVCGLPMALPVDEARKLRRIVNTITDQARHRGIIRPKIYKFLCRSSQCVLFGLLQVRLLLTKLQHVALMRDTVEKFAVLNTEMKQIEQLRKVSRPKVRQYTQQILVGPSHSNKNGLLDPMVVQLGGRN